MLQKIENLFVHNFELNYFKFNFNFKNNFNFYFNVKKLIIFK